jgi:hypothetical protein
VGEREAAQDWRLTEAVANGAHQPQALLQADDGGVQPALFAVHLAQVEQDLSLPALPAELSEAGQALFQPGDGVIEPTLLPSIPPRADRLCSSPSRLPVSRNATLLEAGAGLVEPGSSDIEVGQAAEHAALSIAIAHPAGRRQRHRVGVLPVVPAGPSPEEADQRGREPPTRLPDVGIAPLDHGGDQACVLGLQPTQRIALDDCRRRVVERPSGRVASVVVDAAWFQEGIRLLGQCPVGLEHPFQRGPFRRRRLLALQALAGIDAQQVVQAIPQLPGLVLPGRLAGPGLSAGRPRPTGAALSGP